MSLPCEGRPEFVIVIPLYNEEAIFAELVDRVRRTLATMALPAEVILVDDGSGDRTRDLIQDLCHSDSRFRGLLLSRNFGHQTAVSAGLRYARGRFVAVMDGDLQDPPEILPELYARIREGFDVVYAVRQQRKGAWWKRLAYWSFYRVLRSLSDLDIPPDAGDFCLMSERVVRCMNALPERHRFVRGIRTWVGFRQTGYAYQRPERAGGVSKYSVGKLVRLAAEGIFSFSEVPLRLATVLGLLVAGFALLYAAFLVFWRLFLNDSIPGFATVATAIFFLGGVQLICLGIIGEYIGRIHNETRGRPTFIIDQEIGFQDDAAVHNGSVRK